MSKAKKYAHLVLQERRFNERVRQDTLSDSLLKDEVYRALHCERVDLRAKMVSLGTQTEDFTKTRTRYDEIVNAMQKRMEELGVNKEDFATRYHCPICKDTGYTNGQECNCLKQLVYSYLRESCGKLVTEESDFESVDYSVFPKEYQESYKHFYTVLKKLASVFPANNSKIFGVFGPVGVGKTYGISILANNLMQKGYSVMYLNSAEMNAIFLKYHLAKTIDKMDIWEPLVECDLLVLDDLGAENTITNVTANYLLNLLNEREDKTTCFTSNLTPDNLREKYGDRIFSRMSHKKRSAILTLNSKDLRLS